MPRFAIRRHIIIALISLALTGAASIAQDAPKPAGRSYVPAINGGDQNDQDQPGPPMIPDQNPVTGAAALTLGTPEMRHSYWVPGFSFQNSFLYTMNGTTGWISSSYMVGTFTMDLASRHSQLDLNYSGGGSITNSNLFPNTYFHGLSMSQAFNWNRGQLLFLDQFSYLPQSSFGFGGVSPIGAPGVGGSLGATFPGLQNNYSSGQSLFGGNGPRINNSGIIQLDYELTRRASLTAVGSYGLLHFVNGNANAIDTRNAIGSLGYNYELTRLDTIGVLYRYSSYRYLGNPQALEDHSVNLAYGRKITGRLALQLTGGPDRTIYRVPINGETGRTSFYVGTSLNYGFQHEDLALNYSHGLAGGSGVFAGSDQDRVDAHFSSDLGRHWKGLFGAGYSRNAPIAANSTGAGAPELDSVFASAGLNRQLGPTINFSASYNYNHQNLSFPVCIVSCGASYTQHQIWIGFQWRARPVVIR